MTFLNDLLAQPAFNTALIATLIAFMLWIQSVLRERIRKNETKLAREKIAAATADKVVEKITNASMMPLPPNEDRITANDTPEAKEEGTGP